MLSIRCSSEDENLIKKFAAIKKQSVSEFLRQAALEKIEDETELLEIQKEYKTSTFSNAINVLEITGRIGTEGSSRSCGQKIFVKE